MSLSRQWSRRSASLAAGGVLLLWLALLAPGRAATFCINYSATPDAVALREFDFSILSPDARVDVPELRRLGHRTYAYLSVVEVARDAPYRAEVVARQIPLLGKNEVWLGDFADVSQPAWADFVVNTLAARAAQKGFSGFFLDTVDSVEQLEKQFPERGTVFREGLIALVKALKAKFPQHPVILNRGFPILARLTSSVDGVLAESLFRKFDFKEKRYVAVEPAGTQWLLNILRTVSKAGLPVYVVDYLDASDTQLAEEVARRISGVGFTPFISTVELDGKFLTSRTRSRGALASVQREPPVTASAPRAVPALPPVLPAPAVTAPAARVPLESGGSSPLQPGEVPRFVLALFGNSEPDVEELVRWPVDSGTAQVAQMPLEWLGYEVDYLNVHQRELPATLDSRYAAIILDRFLTLPRGKEAAMADWLIAQKGRGCKVIFFGGLPFNDDAVTERVLKAFGCDGTGRAVKNATNLRVLTAAKQLNFEAPLNLTPAGFRDIRAPAGSEVLLSLATGDGRQFDPLFIAPWGGVMLEPYALFRRPDLDELWLVDPFHFFKQALGRPDMPVPDTTTRDGERIFFSHIDGDGFRHASSVEIGRRSGEIIVERIIKKYPFPFTVSFIEAEVRGIVAGQKSGDAESLTRQAREVLAMPKVEAASHSYTHPFYWNAGDRTVKEYARANLQLTPPHDRPGAPLDLRREITGSVDYIERELCPPGKRVKIFLWSGNCRPWPEGLRLVRELGIENMNGGETAISRKRPSVTRVSARALPWEGELQISSANENENIYRERWAVSGDTESPFFGGFLLAQDGFERMEQPRRLKPVNIYFHFYSGDNLASLNALTRLFEWAAHQELHSLTAAGYARLVRDARGVRVIRESDTRWTLVSAGVLRTFRLPRSVSVPDLAASRGVTGWRASGDVIYIHTDGSPRVELALSTGPGAHLRLEASTAEIQFSKLAAREAAFTVRDVRACRVSLAGLPPNATATVAVNGQTTARHADAGGVLKMELPAEARVEVRL
ncbi:MAG: endo alpha-1,4 polygalactosaminidase [Limisphaerales bacterium]